MCAYFSVMRDDVAHVLERARLLTTVVTIEMLELGRTTCQGPALRVVKAVERDNGVEVLARSLQRYEPYADPRLQNMIIKILPPGR